jgi:hypothetical protein
VYSNWSASTSLATTVHSTEDALNTICRVRGWRVVTSWK